jgi:hypothetical protein
MKMVRATLLIALTVGCGLGCGGGTAKSDGGGGTGGTVASGTGPYLPLKVGDSWNYQVTDKNGDVSVKVQSVVAEETVGGTGPSAAKTAFRLVTGSKVNDPDGDISWQAIVAERVVRYREQSIDGGSGKVKNEQFWDPPRLRLDESAEHIAANASWLEPEYTETDVDIDTFPDGGTDGDGGTTYIPDGGVVVQDKIHDLWSVVSPSQIVTVPAGTFDALVVRRVGDSGASVKTFWFARGVGKIREAEEGKGTEELISAHVVP